MFLVIRGVFTIKECLLSEEIQFALLLSFKTSIISTLICLIISLPVSFTLSRLDFKFKKIISTILYIPMSLPHLILGIALLLVCGNSFIGRFLQSIGLDFVFTVKGIVLAQVFVNISFSIKMLKTAIDGSNSKMEFVARTLGCSRFKCFYKVTLPLIKKDIISTLIITFSRALGEFGAVMLLVGTTRMRTEILPTSIYLNVSTGDMDIAIGVATILIIISMLTILPFEILEGKNNVRN
ncbi:ABC transporter permease [Eubacterium multiforme]|uniref:Molybdate transport system permease protein n=1 Tax=Eubacterium multiforme TaxID=83339 RepID=A0ABT9UTV4_9FIRM|nr:ABC transporter permease [Eubacterium multiforme]MDQ0149747.1 molybdate transport system permease protein [Eubacterium multiforme]